MKKNERIIKSLDKPSISTAKKTNNSLDKPSLILKPASTGPTPKKK
ncbi:hypothetical protein [Bacillus wiedmannii]|nr:hypothetical protein [Bacillus wiedmannii]MDM5267592.1 hypothetical protein [Bacillus wiedmannii]